MLLYETSGEKYFHYYYDSNGTLYAVNYKLGPNDTSVRAYYFTHNWRGDIVGIYNGNGELRARYEYDSWGNVLSITDQNGNAITDENHIANLNPFRYRSYYMDTETGMYYLMSRYYDPVTHRFLNADGYFQTGLGILDANMNAYCKNNPIMDYDPTGTISAKAMQHDLTYNQNSPYTLKNTIMQAKYEAGYIDSPPSAYYTDYEKWQQTAWAVFSSLQLDADVGFGLGVTMTAYEVLDISVLARFSPLIFHCGIDCIDAGYGGYIGAGVSAVGWDLISVGENSYTSYVTGETTTELNEDHVIGISAGAYFILGGQIRLGWNLDYIVNEIDRIWFS